MQENNKNKKTLFFIVLIGIILVVIFYFFFMMFGHIKNTKLVGNSFLNYFVQDNNMPEIKNIKITSRDHIRGNKNAKITIIEYADMECPFCADFHLTLKQVVEAYPEDVKWVFKHFPLEFDHPMSRNTAEASECAGEQNKFWEYVDGVFANQINLSNDFLISIAKTINLDIDKFNTCLNNSIYSAKIDSDFMEGVEMGIVATPGGFINNYEIPGAVSFEELKSAIERLKQ